MNIRYELQTDIVTPATVIQKLDLVDMQGVRETIFRHALDTGEEHVRQALIRLGWTPPSKEQS